jgi:putative FmdB family regulatory protein
MPLYEYDCQGCGQRFEILVRDSTPPTCPSCGGTILERVLSLFAVNSEGTRRSALEAGRKHQAKSQRDKKIADHEALHHHHH